MHPAGRAHRRLVEQHALAGAQDGAVAARERPLLVAQHDVAVVRAVRHEERDEPAVPPLLVASGRDSARRSRPRRAAGPRPAPRPAAGCAPARKAPPTRGTKSPSAAGRRSIRREVGVARRFGVVGLEEAEERPCRLPRPARASRSATGSSGRRPRAGAVRSADRGRRRSGPLSRYAGPSSCIASVAKAAAPSRQPCATHGCAPPWARFCRLITTGPQRACRAT